MDGDLPEELILWHLILNAVSKEEALQILEEIENNVNTCCAITMEPEDVLDLIVELRNFLEKL